MLRQHYGGLGAPTLSDDALRRVPVLVALLLMALLVVFGGTLTPSLSQPQPGHKKYISPWEQQQAAGTDEPMAMVLEQRAREYFAAWNKHDAEWLAQLFEERGTLQDWETVAHGRERVVEANTKIWAAVPDMAIEIVGIHPSPATRTVACEILVRFNDGAETFLKVVDIIEFGTDQRIASLRAYKG